MVAAGDPRPERRPVGPAHGGRGRHQRGHLHPSGHDDVVGAGRDPLGGEVQRLFGRAALALDGHARDVLGPAGGQGRVAGDVRRLGADLADAPEDDVVDEARLERPAAVAVHEGFEAGGRQVDRVPAAQAAVAPPHRRAHRVDDDGPSHVVAPAPTSVAALPDRSDSARHGTGSGSRGAALACPACSWRRTLPSPGGGVADPTGVSWRRGPNCPDRRAPAAREVDADGMMLPALFARGLRLRRTASAPGVGVRGMISPALFARGLRPRRTAPPCSPIGRWGPNPTGGPCGPAVDGVPLR